MFTYLILLIPPNFHPPVLQRSVWHVPAFIVQAEPLALFKICIRMLFLYSSKRRHVEALLKRSANRWRFSRRLYEIKRNIPIKKTLPCVPFTLRCLTFFLSHSSLLRLFFSFFSFFYGSPRAWARAAPARRKATVEGRQVCVTDNCFPRRARQHQASQSEAQQTGPVSRRQRLLVSPSAP